MKVLSCCTLAHHRAGRMRGARGWFSFLCLLSLFLLSVSCAKPTGGDTGNIPPVAYTMYRTGSSQDTHASPLPGVCMMGGGPEVDEAMRWFLERAAGGDVLVMRASGSDGYNAYLYQELGVPVHSVTTIVVHEPGEHHTLLDLIDRAEAIWFAGGDQQRYLELWQGNRVQTALQSAIDRGVPVGGTSAGMAILGEFIWDGEEIRTEFLDTPFLDGVITETHYDERAREARFRVMLEQTAGRGIAGDEAAAMCYGPDGIAQVFADPSSGKGMVFFSAPDQSVKVQGDRDGSGRFDLGTWAPVVNAGDSAWMKDVMGVSDEAVFGVVPDARK